MYLGEAGVEEPHQNARQTELWLWEAAASECMREDRNEDEKLKIGNSGNPAPNVDGSIYIAEMRHRLCDTQRLLWQVNMG